MGPDTGALLGEDIPAAGVWIVDTLEWLEEVTLVYSGAFGVKS